MKKSIPVFFAIVLIIGLFFIVNKTNQVEADSARAVGGENVETWVMGITSEGETQYSSLAGRIVTTVAGFRADRGVNEQYFVFPAPAELKVVNAASVNLISSNGSTPSGVFLTLEVHDLDGSLVHTVSDPIDVTLLSLNSWADFVLSQTAGDLEIQSGEVLVAHLSFAEAGDLDLQCIFDIEVE